MIEGMVNYWDLGRSKAKGTIKINVNSEEEFNWELDKEFKKHLLSNEISFGDGKIYAGFHSVGNFEFIAIEIKSCGNKILTPKGRQKFLICGNRYTRSRLIYLCSECKKEKGEKENDITQ